ncbi:hypothetical protein [Bartonella birtlesii]|uniref:hypothetical protein n=1 Tax=Bartonella birtlesii TaxID=111504 RepID=UPI003CC9141C
MKNIADILSVPLTFLRQYLHKTRVPYPYDELHEEVASSREEHLLLKRFRILTTRTPPQENPHRKNPTGNPHRKNQQENPHKKTPTGNPHRKNPTGKTPQEKLKSNFTTHSKSNKSF